MTRLSQAELISGLERIVGPLHLSVSKADRVAYSADFWPRAQIWKQLGDIDRYPPDCIVWPANESEVSGILEFCHDNLIPVVPYGGGSGVCGGTVPLHGGVVVDTKRLKGVVSLDRQSHTVRAQTGINGQHLESWLNREGFTLGHFPSSIMCSTLGGWLSTRAAGQFSSRYGKIEDMVLGVRVVVPGGEVMDTARRSLGAPDWTQLFVGSEGTLGLFTEAELKVSPLPSERRLRAFRFRNMADGLQAMRSVMQSGLRPMVLRLYDPFDSLIALGKDTDKDKDDGAAGVGGAIGGPLAALKGLLVGKEPGAGTGGLPSPPSLSSTGAPAPSHLATGKHVRRGGFLRRLAGERRMNQLARLSKAAQRAGLVGALSAPGLVNRLAEAAPSPCLMIVGFEGAEQAVHADAWSASELIAAAGGGDAGARLGEAWLAHRYSVGFKQARVFQMGAFVDTMEVATTWDRLDNLYDAVREALSPHVFIMAHFSHAYRVGCSIYFTFVGYRRDHRRAEELYERVWRLGTDAVLGAGGTVSHHHGVGIAKRNAMAREHGPMLAVWRALKGSVDPHHIMNPGKLFPDDATGGEVGGAAPQTSGASNVKSNSVAELGGAGHTEAP